MGAGSLREAGEERAGRETGNPRGQEPGEIGNKLRNIAQFFTVEREHKGGNRKGRGRELGVHTGSGIFFFFFFSFQERFRKPVCGDYFTFSFIFSRFCFCFIFKVRIQSPGSRVHSPRPQCPLRSNR